MRINSATLTLIVIMAFGACTTVPDTVGNEHSDTISADSTTSSGTSSNLADTVLVELGSAEAVLEAPTRDPECDEPDPEQYGAQVPWAGFEHDGQSYTCNTCPGGVQIVQGVWRAVHFETEDPDTPLGGDWKETITFDGNLWQQHSTGLQDGATVDAILEGWYWCGSKPEVSNQAKVFVITKAEPENALGYVSGDVLTADLLVNGTSKLDFAYYEGFNTGQQVDSLYCRVGEVVVTTSGEEKYCGDPF